MGKQCHKTRWILIWFCKLYPEYTTQNPGLNYSMTKEGEGEKPHLESTQFNLLSCEPAKIILIHHSMEWWMKSLDIIHQYKVEKDIKNNKIKNNKSH